MKSHVLLAPRSATALLVVLLAGSGSAFGAAAAIPTAGSRLPAAPNKVITAADVTVEKVGTSIPASAIGEPVGGVTLAAPQWVDATETVEAYASVDGAIQPVDPNGKPINFRVLLPASWNHRAAQIGGGGMNGTITVTGGRGGMPGWVQYGSDSGHQAGGRGGAGAGGRGRGAPGAPGAPGAAPGNAAPGGPGPGAGAPAAPANVAGGPGRAGAPAGPAAAPGGARGGNPAIDEWALNEEAIKNLGYMQMKKTHDAVMVILERVYGEKPRFNYYIGTSQGGREALTVAQRYPADYDGIIANVPIVNFSTLMLAPELVRIQEKPLANWVTPAKVNAIRGEFMRQADKLDGLADGVINNYMAARKLFDLSQGDPNRNPWAALRAPNGVDPDPADTSASAKLTDGQISTLKLVYSRYKFATPLANGVTSFGMWVPNTDPSGSGLILANRFRGQEGAAADAPMHSHLGVLGVTAFLMQNLAANPLDYVEGGALNARRRQLSEWLDSTNPDLTAFYRRGGKMIVTIGTDDTLASPGAQLDYYQSLLDRMGRDTVDAFARLFVIPQANHGLTGRSYGTNGDGQAMTPFAIPNTYDRVAYLTAWVERNEAPAKTLTVTAGDRSMPLVSYPNYAKYIGGPADQASSYESTAP
jgi:hypothetical protein